jgi:hypothetical protein
MNRKKSPGLPQLNRRAWIRHGNSAGIPARAGSGRSWRHRQPALLLNLSRGGIGLLLAESLPKGTVLQVAIDGWAGQPLWAFVRHVTEHANGWLHGCELSTPLQARELHVLLTAVPGWEATD